MLANAKINAIISVLFNYQHYNFIRKVQVGEVEVSKYDKFIIIIIDIQNIGVIYTPYVHRFFYKLYNTLKK